MFYGHPNGNAVVVAQPTGKDEDKELDNAIKKRNAVTSLIREKIIEIGKHEFMDMSAEDQKQKIANRQMDYYRDSREFLDSIPESDLLIRVQKFNKFLEAYFAKISAEYNTKVRGEVPKLKPSQKKSQKKPNHGNLTDIKLIPNRDPKKNEAIIELSFDDSKQGFTKETGFSSLKTSDENVIGFKMKGVKLNQIKQLKLPKDKDIEYVVAKPGERDPSEWDVGTIEVYIKFKNAKAKDVGGTMYTIQVMDLRRDNFKALQIRIPRWAMATDSSGSSSAEAVTMDTSKVATLFSQLPKNVNLVGKPAMAVAIGQNADGTPKYMAVKITKRQIRLNEKSFQLRKHTKILGASKKVACNIDEAKIVNNKMQITLSFIGIEGTVTLTEDQVLNVFSMAMAIPSVRSSSEEIKFGPKDKGSILWAETDQGFEIPSSFKWNRDTQSLEKETETTEPAADAKLKTEPEFKLDLTLNFPLKEGEKPVPEDALRSGSAPVPNTRFTRDLLRQLKKEINRYFTTDFNKVSSFDPRYDETTASNLFLARGDKPAGSINLTLKLIMKADRNFIKQVAKDSGLDLNKEAAQEEMNKIFNDGLDKITKGLVKNQAMKGLKQDLFKPFIVVPEGGLPKKGQPKNADLVALQASAFQRRYTNDPKVIKTKWDFEGANIDTALAPGSEDIEDPYNVSEFNKRQRLIEYIPTDFLKFSSESIFTVTFDLPGNGFDEFLAVNPTVIRGRAPFDKSAPGEKEVDRTRLLNMLKRNRLMFVKFLNKLEEIASFVGPDGRREKIEFGRYSLSDYRIYKQYFESYIKLFDAGIAAIENVGTDDFESILRRSYNLNLMVAAIYNL